MCVQTRPVLRDCNRRVGQGGCAEGGQVNINDPVFENSEGFGDLCGAGDLTGVSLAVTERQCAAIKAFICGDGKRRSGIETSAQKNDGFFSLITHSMDVLSNQRLSIIIGFVWIGEA